VYDKLCDECKAIADEFGTFQDLTDCATADFENGIQRLDVAAKFITRLRKIANKPAIPGLPSSAVLWTPNSHTHTHTYYILHGSVDAYIDSQIDP
jgi:hypothetical protein